VRTVGLAEAGGGGRGARGNAEPAGLGKEDGTSAPVSLWPSVEALLLLLVS